MTQRVDKDSLSLNQPRRTPSHPTKSHIVKTKVDGKEKIIRFGEQGASTAGKPKAGESDRMTAKRDSFKSRHAKNIAKGPASAAYWANKVKWADGGAVRTHYAEGDSVNVTTGGSYREQDTVSATPQNAILGAIARGLQSGDDLMSKPVTYQFGKRSTEAIPPTAFLSELMGVPALARTAERMSYGDRLTSGSGQTLRPLNDTTDALLTVLPMAGPLARLTGKGAKAGARVVGQELNRAMLDNSGPLAKFIPEAVKPAYVVPPQGNLNLTPMARAEILKGPETQTSENFLNQLRSKPGMTQEGFDDLVKRYQGLEPNTRMTKAEFEQRIPASQYNKVDLADAAASNEEHLFDQAAELANQDLYVVYEGVLDRLGVSNRPENLRMLDEYHNDPAMSFGELSQNSELNQAIKQAGMDSPEGRQLLDDLFQEEHNNLMHSFYDDLLGESEQGGSYAYQRDQRLMQNADKYPDGYFELGVSHPELRGSYRHYPAYQGDEGLIGHVRGTLIPADATDEARQLIIKPSRFKREPGESDEVLMAEPNSMVIEEIQSDAQKGKAQSGALRQAHGTMFKAAIQHALENGVTTVYLPTANSIAHARSAKASKYAPIYDQQVVKEGLNPLLKIPGVSSEKIGDSWIKIDFTPEANDLILKGEGQVAPGYAEGGMVKASAYDPLKIDAIMASIDAPRNYAKGGSVMAYDPSRIDEIVNQFM